MKKNNSAFTLLEILLASVIFVITVGGVFVTINAVRKPVADKESALTAAIFGKQVLEALRSKVDAGTFYTPCTTAPCKDFSLTLGPHQVPYGNLPPGLSWPQALISSNPPFVPGVGGTLIYTVSCADLAVGDVSCGPGGANPDKARQVSLSINWPDAP